MITQVATPATSCAPNGNLRGEAPPESKGGTGGDPQRVLARPALRAVEDAVGEYNGKFMSGQFVLRDGPCDTLPGHVRASYRSFFPPHMRWQFAGLRLAEDP